MAIDKVLECFRGVCTNGAHPLGYNRVTHGLYCLECARFIERTNFARMSMYPLLKFAADVINFDGGAWEAGLVLLPPKLVKKFREEPPEVPFPDLKLAQKDLDYLEWMKKSRESKEDNNG